MAQVIKFNRSDQGVGLNRCVPTLHITELETVSWSVSGVSVSTAVSARETGEGVEVSTHA